MDYAQRTNSCIPSKIHDPKQYQKYVQNPTRFSTSNPPRLEEHPHISASIYGPVYHISPSETTPISTLPHHQHQTGKRILETYLGRIFQYLHRLPYSRSFCHDLRHFLFRFSVPELQELICVVLYAGFFGCLFDSAPYLAKISCCFRI